MSDGTLIEYADASWPVVAGCDHVSPGCDNCYAARLTSGRLKHLTAYAGLAEGGRFNGQIRMLEDRLDQPLHWRKPRRIFVSDMADLFHDKVTADFIADVFAVMALTPQHTYLVFTKRHARMRALLNSEDFWYQVGRKARHLGYTYDSGANHLGDGRNIYDTTVWTTLRYLPNVWLLVSVENQQWADIRIPALLGTPAAVRGISAEPLLGPINLRNLQTFECPSCCRSDTWTNGRSIAAGDEVNEYWCQVCGAEVPIEGCVPGIGWVVAGGESGPGARPVHPGWIRSLRGQCEASGVPFFLKQWGAHTPYIPKVPDATRPDGQAPDWDHRSVWVEEATGRTVTTEPDTGSWQAMYPVGKKRAGRTLDGQTWNQYPESTS